MAVPQTPRYLLFQVLLAIGAIVGILLLVQSIRTYGYVANRLVQEELYRESARQSAYILQLARESDVRDPGALGPVFEQVIRERPDHIAWLKALALRGETLAASGNPGGPVFSEQDLRQTLEEGDRQWRVVETPEGRLLVALRPLRIRWGSGGRPPEPPATGQGTTPPRGGPAFLEIALRWETMGTEFGPLRRAMIVNVLAAVALLTSMALLGLRFRNYLHGKQLEHQLELARNVQQNLLPKDTMVKGNLDVAAQCEPAWRVGGDFYDVFQAADNRVALILGDVSGKGVPAALLMGLLHGAVRSNCALRDATDLEGATRSLNDLLCTSTPPERFVTMFWCHYDPDSRTLSYVNAGHPAPYLIRETDGHRELLRLEVGGPVLGIVPDANYLQGEVDFEPGDVLFVFSDGVVETEDERGNEFGEQRLEAILRQDTSLAAADLRDKVLAAVRKFAGGQEQQDDITLMVVRAGVPVEDEETAEAYTVRSI